MKAALMLAVNPAVEREELDFYATDPYAITKAIPVFREIGLCQNVWECACGEGHLSKELSKYGYCVKSTDIADRGFGEVQDFLATDCEWDGDILTNPPFKHAADFIEHAMEVIEEGHLAVFFLKVQFLETVKRAKMFKRCGLKYVIVNSERVCCAMHGDFEKHFKRGQNGEWRGGTQCFCWFVFQKGFRGEPTIKWIYKEKDGDNDG